MTKNQIHCLFMHLHSDGWSIPALCEKFGICKSAAYNWIRDYSPVKRTKGRTITAHETSTNWNGKTRRCVPKMKYSGDAAVLSRLHWPINWRRLTA